MEIHELEYVGDCGILGHGYCRALSDCKVTDRPRGCLNKNGVGRCEYLATCPRKPRTEVREKKLFWVLHNDTIQRLEGLICEDNPGYWFIPEIGSSCCEGFHLFDTFDIAKKVLLLKIDTHISSLEKSKRKVMELTEPEETRKD